MSVVAIVGRPNVGKSTLFNRLVGRRLAIVEDVPGVTRDRNYAPVLWDDRRFTLVDTGGLDLDPGPEEDLVERMGAQVLQAVEEADHILFVVSVREGFLPADAEIARYLRRRAKDVILVVNKVDGPSLESATLEFHAAGFENVVTLSSEHGVGVDELVSQLENRIPPGSEGEEEPDTRVRVAVLGRPNVGKSSLVNHILGQERLVVSPEAGTTRDAIDTEVTVGGRDYLMIDTAGIRRKARVVHGTEQWSVLKAIRTIDRSHVCLVLLDATEGLTDQDMRILNLVLKGGRGAVLCLNKWDAVAKDGKTYDGVVADLRDRLGTHRHVPILSLSALTGQRVPRLFELVNQVHGEWSKRISTSAANNFLEASLRELAPPVVGGKRARIYYVSQVASAPPVFAAFTSYPKGLPVAYHRFLLKRLRATFGFDGVPVRFSFRGRTRSREG